MTKCNVCHQQIQTQYLEKPLATVVKDVKGKKHWICNACQSKFHNKKEVLLRQVG